MAMFKKILSKTDTSKRLSVPTKYLKSLPPFKTGSHVVEFQAKDEEGNVWSFQCSIRKKGQYSKPVLSKGWLQFVSSKKLKPGDKIMVCKATNNDAPFYGVRIEKKIKLLGTIFYAPML